MKLIFCTGCGCVSVTPWLHWRCTITTSCTSRWRKYKKRWRKDTKTSWSTACAFISKPTRKRRLRRPEVNRWSVFSFWFLVFCRRLNVSQLRGSCLYQARIFNCQPRFTPSCKLRGAVAAALRRQRNRHRALWAVFGGRRRNWRWFRRETIDLFDQKKDEESHYQEIDHVIDEDPVIQRCLRRGRGLGRLNRIEVCAAQVDKQSRKIHATEQLADGRHDHVFHERRDNFSEGRADNHADRQIHDIATHGEFLEFFQHGRPPSFFR